MGIGFRNKMICLCIVGSFGTLEANGLGSRLLSRSNVSNCDENSTAENESRHRKKVKDIVNIIKDANLPLEDKKAAIDQLNAFYTSPTLSNKDKDKIKECVRDISRELLIISFATYFRMSQEEFEKLRDTIPEGKFPSITIDKEDPRIINWEGKRKSQLKNGAIYYEQTHKNPDTDVMLLTEAFFESRKRRDGSFEPPIMNGEQVLEKYTREFSAAMKLQDPEKKEEQLNALLQKVKNHRKQLSSSSVQNLLEIYNSFPRIDLFFKRSSDGVVAGQAGSRTQMIAKELLKLGKKIEEKL
jgi:uncharacterized protein YaaR (DUF327 family)